MSAVVGLRELPFSPQISDDSLGHWAASACGEFAFQRCADCGMLRWPAGPVCPSCWSPSSRWQSIEPRGVLQTWVVYRREYFPEFPVPYAVGQAEFTGGVRYQALLELPLDELEPGRVVRVDHRPAAGRLPDGSTLRLPVFVGGAE